MQLRGFEGFLGGLDNDRNLTGRDSVFAEFSGLDVMFHVAPLMPFSANDPQQVSTAIHTLVRVCVCVWCVCSCPSVCDGSLSMLLVCSPFQWPTKPPRLNGP